MQERTFVKKSSSNPRPKAKQESTLKEISWHFFMKLCIQKGDECMGLASFVCKVRFHTNNLGSHTDSAKASLTSLKSLKSATSSSVGHLPSILCHLSCRDSFSSGRL